MKNVLLLVDQRENRRLLIDNLSDRHQVEAPSVEEQSVAKALDAPLDLVIADGISLSRFLRENGADVTIINSVEALAAAAREQAAARLRVHTEWSTTRTSVRVIIALPALAML